MDRLKGYAWDQMNKLGHRKEPDFTVIDELDGLACALHASGCDVTELCEALNFAEGALMRLHMVAKDTMLQANKKVRESSRMEEC